MVSISVATSVRNHNRLSVGSSSAILSIIIGYSFFCFSRDVKGCFTAYCVV